MNREYFLSLPSNNFYLLPKAGEIVFSDFKISDVRKVGRYHKNTDIIKMIVEMKNIDVNNFSDQKILILNHDLDFEVSSNQTIVNDILIFSRVKRDSIKLFDLMEMINFAIEAKRKAVNKFVKELFYDGNSDVCHVVLVENFSTQDSKNDVLKEIEIIAKKCLFQYEMNGCVGGVGAAFFEKDL